MTIGFRVVVAPAGRPYRHETYNRKYRSFGIKVKCCDSDSEREYRESVDSN